MYETAAEELEPVDMRITFARPSDDDDAKYNTGSCQRGNYSSGRGDPESITGCITASVRSRPHFDVLATGFSAVFSRFSEYIYTVR